MEQLEDINDVCIKNVKIKIHHNYPNKENLPIKKMSEEIKKLKSEGYKIIYV